MPVTVERCRAWPFPLRVMGLVTEGRPFGSSMMLSTSVSSTSVVSSMISTPLPAGQAPVAVSVLVAVMASGSVQRPVTVIVAASAGTWPNAKSKATPPSERA
ncbi:MAG: hypothetical protein ACREXX_06755 [Gammaproteobacteria bacterium]